MGLASFVVDQARAHLDEQSMGTIEDVAEGA